MNTEQLVFTASVHSIMLYSSRSCLDSQTSLVVFQNVHVYVFTWGYMETSKIAVHLIPLLHPCGVLLVENSPEYHQRGKHPQERDQLLPPQKKRLE